MSDIYVYNNQLWETIHTFRPNVNSIAQPFELEPGTYLMICNGAHGGKGYYSEIQPGGSAYGILDLDETSSFYAYVGTNGLKAIDPKTETNIIPSEQLEPGPNCQEIYIDREDYWVNQEYQDPTYDYIRSSSKCVTEYKVEGGINIAFHQCSDYTGSICIKAYDVNDRALWFSVNFFNESSGSYPHKMSSIPVKTGTEIGIPGYMVRNYDYFTISLFRLPDEDTEYNSSRRETIAPSEVKSVILIKCETDYPEWYGMNGGALGTDSNYSSQTNFNHYIGAGGGGASDVRLVAYDPEDPSTLDASLNSRIIVAGGGGGGTNISPSLTYPNDCGFGGGVYGGPLAINHSDVNYDKYATQDTGYAFGQGMIPVKPEGSRNGSGGGGGGWFGGYAAGSPSVSETWCNGGGGSGYVLTGDSYKPTGYDPDEKYYFRNVLLDVGSSPEPSVIICKFVRRFKKNDKLIVNRTGSKQTISMPPGEYIIKCYGGDGGIRYTRDSQARGGFSVGTFSPIDIYDWIFVVGGSGRFCHADVTDSTFISTCNPSLSYNGGGAFVDNSIKGYSTAGGGATDVRIGSDSLYARLIVAGGAGGETSYVAGSGGGPSGVAGSGRYGTNPGPGTQTASPHSGDQSVWGDFGYGGNAGYRPGGYGGAGGSGWYGGAGCYPITYDDSNYAGSGGSGYVLTEDSYKPDNYLLDDPRYYLSNAETVVGGNDLIPGQTRIEVIVNEVGTIINMLAKDAEGFKKYDKVNLEWIPLGIDNPTEEDFEIYGITNFTSDTGLLDEYQLYVYWEGSNPTCNLSVVPPTLTLSRKVSNSAVYVSYDINGSYADDAINIDGVFHKNENDDNLFTLHIDKLKPTSSGDTIPKIYRVDAASTGNKEEGRYVPPKTPVIPKTRNLLKAGQGNIPISTRYKTDYLDTLGYAVNSIESFCSVIYDMSLYVGIQLNNSVIRFLTVGLTSGHVDILREVNKSDVGGSCGCMLVDDNNIYFAPFYGYSNTSTSLYVIPLDPLEEIQTYSFGKTMTHGKMFWYNTETIIFVTREGYSTFNTIKKRFTHNTGKNAYIYDFALGNNTLCAAYGSTAYFCDIETNTWTSFSSSTSGENRICYYEGKYYVGGQNKIVVIDEETHSVERVITVSTNSHDVSTLICANGVLYFSDGYRYTESYRTKVTSYNIATDEVYSVIIPWVLPNTDYGMIWSVMNNTLFIPYFSIGIFNYTGKAKYDFGAKYNVDFLNYDTSSISSFEPYDNRFITFYSSHVRIHDGIISKQFTSSTGNLKYVNINKNEYRSIKIVNITE